MKAIFFDRNKTRHSEEIEAAVDELSIIRTNGEVSHKVVYKIEFYDTKGRPVYVEKERSEIETAST